MVRYVSCDINYSAIARNGDARRNLVRALHQFRQRQRDGKQRRDRFVRADAKNLDVAVDVRQINSRAFRRKRDAGETQFIIFVGVEIFFRVRRLFLHFVRRKRDGLGNFSSRRINHEQPVRQPRSHEQPAVGTQRQRIRTDVRQFDLRAGGRDKLVDRRDKTVRDSSDGLGRGVKIVRENPDCKKSANEKPGVK